MTKKFKSLDALADFLEEEHQIYLFDCYDSPLDGDDVLPCFSTRLRINTRALPEEFISPYLELCVKEFGKGVLMFSVTEMETGFKNWLKAAVKFKGATITVGRSRHGQYKCFFVCIPCEPRLTNYKMYLK